MGLIPQKNRSFAGAQDGIPGTFFSKLLERQPQGMNLQGLYKELGT